MCTSRSRDRLRPLLALSLALAAIAFAATPAAASAEESPPTVGSTQACVGTQGGVLLQINGFGSSFPSNTTGTVTFTFANGDVVSLTATTNEEGVFHTETFTLDLSDPEIAALVGTRVQETASFGPAQGSLIFTLVACSASPDERTACKRGGFESYPALGFRNQGDCVSWIATQSKNEPYQPKEDSP
jgi:hypothetical protein